MATVFDMFASIFGSTTALFFGLLILLVCVVYIMLELDNQGKGLSLLVGKTNAIYNTLYGEEGVQKIRDANRMLQETMAALQKIEAMRKEAQEIVARGEKP